MPFSVDLVRGEDGSVICELFGLRRLNASLRLYASNALVTSAKSKVLDDLAELEPSVLDTSDLDSIGFVKICRELIGLCGGEFSPEALLEGALATVLGTVWRWSRSVDSISPDGEYRDLMSAICELDRSALRLFFTTGPFLLEDFLLLRRSFGNSGFEGRPRGWWVTRAPRTNACRSSESRRRSALILSSSVFDAMRSLDPA